MRLSSLKPAATKPWLIALAGLMWSVVGILLCRLAYDWLAVVHWEGFASLELFGILMALVVYQLCFSKIARKNITRLSLLTEKTCIFAFQRWKSYALIGVMVTLGITLRSLPIPKPYLAVLYTTIGGALFLASFQYYGCLWRTVTRKTANLPSGSRSESR
jgi:hypothetical protein